MYHKKMNSRSAGIIHDAWHLWDGGRRDQYACHCWKRRSEDVIPISLDDEEKIQLKNSADILNEMKKMIKKEHGIG